MKRPDDFELTAIPHKNHLYHYAFYITQNLDDAQDLLQDTFLRAYRFWDKFEDGTNIKAWLYRIMKNAYINRYRKERKEPRKICYEEYHMPYNAVQETPFSSRYVQEKSHSDTFGDEITRSIESLSDSFKNVIILSDVEGLSYEEIATIVNCPIGTVRSRLHRGRKLLRKKLFTYAKDNGYITKKTSR